MIGEDQNIIHDSRFCLVSVYLVACKHPVEALRLSPVSIDAIKKLLVAKSYHTTDVGLLPAFKNNSSINRMSASKDTSVFFTDYRKERMTYTLKFIDDTASEDVNEGKAIKGMYQVEDEMHESRFNDEESETPGVKLLFTVTASGNTDTSFTDMRYVTYTTCVKGIHEDQLLLALARETKSRKVTELIKHN